MPLFTVILNYQRSQLVCLMCWKLHSVWPRSAMDIKNLNYLSEIRIGWLITGIFHWEELINLKFKIFHSVWIRYYIWPVLIIWYSSPILSYRQNSQVGGQFRLLAYSNSSREQGLSGPAIIPLHWATAQQLVR